MRISLLKSGNNAGVPTPKKGEAIVALTKDVLTWPTVDADGVTLLGNFVFKPDTSFFKIYMTPSTQEASFDSSGNPDGMGTINKFVGEHPGTTKEAISFFKNYRNEDFVVIYGGCGSSEYKVMGSDCYPMKLSVSGKDGKDGNVNTLTWEQDMINNDLIKFYSGSLDFAEPLSVAGSTVTLSSANGHVYQTASAAVTADIVFVNTDLQDGEIVTIIGGGGVGPYKVVNDADATVGVLTKNGANWIGLTGAVINLKVVVADKTYLVEVSRK